MKVKTRKEVEVTIIMSEEEAKWLKGVMQNSLIDDESVADSKMRKMFWETLEREGV